MRPRALTSLGERYGSLSPRDRRDTRPAVVNETATSEKSPFVCEHRHRILATSSREFENYFGLFFRGDLISCRHLETEADRFSEVQGRTGFLGGSSSRIRRIS